MKNISLLICTTLFLVGMGFHSLSTGATDTNILAEIQSRYEKTNDFEAGFLQEYIGKVMRQSQKGEGKIFFKKKGMMRWDYKVPNQKIISDGKTVWIYQPDENQAVEYNAERMIKEFGFLVGEGDLRRDFKLLSINESPSQREDHIVLEMTPKEPHPAVSKLSLTVHKKTYFIVQVDVFDGLGNVTRTRFADIRTNINLSSSFFQFKVPPGTEVIKMQDSSPEGKESQKK